MSVLLYPLVWIYLLVAGYVTLVSIGADLAVGLAVGVLLFAPLRGGGWRKVVGRELILVPVLFVILLVVKGLT